VTIWETANQVFRWRPTYEEALDCDTIFPSLALVPQMFFEPEATFVLLQAPTINEVIMML